VLNQFPPPQRDSLRNTVVQSNVTCLRPSAGPRASGPSVWCVRALVHIERLKDPEGVLAEREHSGLSHRRPSRPRTMRKGASQGSLSSPVPLAHCHVLTAAHMCVLPSPRMACKRKRAHIAAAAGTRIPAFCLPCRLTGLRLPLPSSLDPAAPRAASQGHACRR